MENVLTRVVIVLALLLQVVSLSDARAATLDDNSPFITGLLGQWPAVALLMQGSGRGGAFDARVFIDDGGRSVVDFGVVKADGGDNLTAFSAKGTLYFENRVRLPGQSQAEAAQHLAIQRAYF